MVGWSHRVRGVVDRPRRYFNAQFEATKEEVRFQTVELAQRQRRELTDELLAALGRLEARVQALDERLDRIERAQAETQATADRAVAVVASAVRRDAGTGHDDPDGGDGGAAA